LQQNILRFQQAFVICDNIFRYINQHKAHCIRKRQRKKNLTLLLCLMWFWPCIVV